jgi:alkaline phosphatase
MSTLGRAALVLLLLLTAAPARALTRGGAPADATARPRNVILMIPDGCGPAAIALARGVAGHPLTLDGILTGAVATRSADSEVTDSAAGATAYATGTRTNNRMLAVAPDGRSLGTLLEAAQARGLATGLVTTADLTDATPAAFAAHVGRRNLPDSIAAAMSDHRIDVLMGGDWLHWRPEAQGGRRPDGRDLVAELRARGGTFVRTPEEMEAVRRPPLLGLFGIGTYQMDLEIDRDTLREPALERMAAKALELLAPARGGFFLMIEGGHIDDAGHDDDPAGVAREVLAYDRAVATVLEFARRDGRTLVVSCADHETGGLGLGRRWGRESPYLWFPDSLRRARASVWRMADSILAGGDAVGVAQRLSGCGPLDEAEQAGLRAAAAADDSVRRSGLLRALGEVESRRARVGWTSGGHTGVDVGLHAYGPGRESFVGLLQNTDVGRRIAGLLGLDLEAATARLRAPTP